MPPLNRLFWPLLTLIILFGFLQAFLQWDESLTVDEPWAANIIRLEPGAMLDQLAREKSQAGYMLLLQAWANLFGESEAALRSLSTLFFCAAILVVGWGGRRLVGLSRADGAGEASGLIAALLFAIGQNAGVAFAATARPYAMLSLLAAIVLVATLVYLNSHAPQKAFGRPTRMGILLLLGVAAAGAIGMLAHVIFSFYLTAVLLAALIWYRQGSAWLLAANLLALATFLALWGQEIFADFGLGATSWMMRSDLLYLLQAFGWTWGVPLTIILIIFAAAALAINRHHLSAYLGERLLLFCALVALVTPVVLFAVTQFTPVFHFRSMSMVLPAASLALALFFQVGVKPGYTSRAAVAGFAAVLVVLALVITAATWLAPEEYPVKDAVGSVVKQAGCGDVIVVGGLANSEVDYYLRRFAAPDCLERIAYPSGLRMHPGWMDVRLWASAPDRLEAQATALASTLAARPGSRVWLFYSAGDRFGAQVTRVLRLRLDSALELVGEVESAGTFYDTIVEYRVPGGGEE